MYIFCDFGLDNLLQLLKLLNLSDLYVEIVTWSTKSNFLYYMYHSACSLHVA